MNLFNRILAVVVLLGTLVLALLFVLFPFGVLELVQYWLTALQGSLAVIYYSNPFLFRLTQGAAALGVVLILGTLLALELRRAKPPTVEIAMAKGGRAAVLLDSVALRLSYHLDQLADVINVRPEVKAKGNVVHVRVDVETTPDVDVPMKTEEIMHVIREVIEERMGLRLGRAEVRIRHAPYPEEMNQNTITGSV